MKLSLTIAGREFGLNLGAKSVSPAVQGFLTGNDVSESTGGAKLASPYSQSTWVYACINTIAKNLQQIPFRISRGADKDENIIESGPVVDLFDRPHGTMDRGLFWANLASWDCLRGEFFILPLDAAGQPVDLASRRTGQIRQMISLTPELFWHMVTGYDLQGWRYTGSPLISPIASQILLPTEVIHARSFNPYLYWRGMSPLVVAMLAAQTDYASAQFMKGLMLNNADTGVIVTTDQQLNEDQRLMVMAALKERKRTAGTADRPLFLGGGAKVEKPTISSADMEFINHRKLNRQEIGAIFGVSDMMLGFSEQKSLGTGAGAEQERYNFIEATITPLCRRLEAAVDPIIKSFGPDLVGWFDVDSLPVMQEARRMRVDTALKVFSMGVPFNEINSVYDLGFPDLPWGDKGYLPFSLTEAGATTPTEPTVPNADPTENPLAKALGFFKSIIEVEEVERESSRALPEKRLAGTLAPPHVCAPNPGFEASLAGSVKQKKGRLSKFFFQQRGRVLAKLDSEVGSARCADRTSQRDVPTIIKGIDDLLNLDAENKELLKGINPLIRMDLEFGGQQLFEELNLTQTFKIPPSDALAFLAKRKQEIQGINETTFNALKGSLKDGLEKGDTYQQLVDRVKEIYTTASESRAEMIALTETNMAVNGGRFEGMKAAGVEKKGWRTSHLENTRESHLANENYSNAHNGIPIDEEWPNGLMYPGDPDGDASEVINCRCLGFALLGDKCINPPNRLSFTEFVARFAQNSPAKASETPTTVPTAATGDQRQNATASRPNATASQN